MTLPQAATIMNRLVLASAVLALLSGCASSSPNNWTGMRNHLNENIYTGEDHI